MENINYKSDFRFHLTLRDYQGKDIGIPDYPWEALFYTYSKNNAFVASYDGSNKTGWVEDNGKILIVCNNHGLQPGILRVEFTSHLPNEQYPDNEDRQVLPSPLDIALVRCAGDRPRHIDVQLLMPYIKGDDGKPFTLEDFTPEQLEDLKRPAKEAAENAEQSISGAIDEMQVSVRTSVDNLQAKADELNEAESQRIAAEESRAADESQRVSNEIQRTAAESLRETAEKKRAEGETLRISAEDARATAEASRRDAEDSRASSEQQRQANELTRTNNETQRGTNEQGRRDAESVRVSAEEARTGAEGIRNEAERKRIEAETKRESSELNREKAEDTRALAEQRRKDAEDARVSAEQARIDAEKTREAEEQKRVDAENLRVVAESERAEQSLYGSYTIDFGETSVQAVDINLCGGDIEITEVLPFNIASVTVSNGESVIEFVPSGFAPFTIKAGASAVWQIERGAEGQNAALGIRYKVII